MSNWLWSTWIQSCFLSFLTCQSSIAGCFSFWPVFQVLFCLFVLLFLYIIVEQWRRKRDCITCELICGRSLRHHINTFSNYYYYFFIVGCALHTSIHDIDTCYVLLLFLTVPHVQNVRTYLLVLLTAPI